MYERASKRSAAHIAGCSQKLLSGRQGRRAVCAVLHGSRSRCASTKDFRARARVPPHRARDTYILVAARVELHQGRAPGYIGRDGPEPVADDVQHLEIVQLVHLPRDAPHPVVADVELLGRLYVVVKGAGSVSWSGSVITWYSQR